MRSNVFSDVMKTSLLLSSSKNNKYLFLQDLTDDFDYRGNQNEIQGVSGFRSSTPGDIPLDLPLDPRNDFVDTGDYMDIEMKVEQKDDNWNDNDNDADYLPDEEEFYDEKKPHRCKHCSKCFRKKSNLYGHIKKVHDGERPYPCHLCSKSFKMKQHLNKHISGSLKQIR